MGLEEAIDHVASSGRSFPNALSISSASPLRFAFPSCCSFRRGLSKSAILLLKQYLKLYLQGAKRGWCVVKGTW